MVYLLNSFMGPRSISLKIIRRGLMVSLINGLGKLVFFYKICLPFDSETKRSGTEKGDKRLIGLGQTLILEKKTSIEGKVEQFWYRFQREI